MLPISDLFLRSFWFKSAQQISYITDLAIWSIVSLVDSKSVWNGLFPLLKTMFKPCFSSFRFNKNFVKFQNYSPSGLLIRSQVGERLPLECSLPFDDQAGDSPVGVSIQSGDLNNTHPLRRVSIGGSCDWKRGLFADERGSKY